MLALFLDNNDDDIRNGLYGKLAIALAGMTAKFSRKVLGLSIGCCHCMLLLVFVKLVADWSKVYWMPCFRRWRVCGLLLVVALDATIVVSVRAIAQTTWVLYFFDQCCSLWFGEVVVVDVVYPPKAERGCGSQTNILLHIYSDYGFGRLA